MNNPKQTRNQWAVAGLGFEFASIVAVGCLIGYGLDRWLGWQPWGMIGGAVLGIVVALYEMIRAALRVNR